MTIPSLPHVPEELCRFYTRPHIGDALVDLIGDDARPARLLDLASGGGALATAASRRWGDGALVTVDIDPRATPDGFAFRRHRHVLADALDPDLPAIVAEAHFDLTLCNPPYRTPEWRPGFARILAEAGLDADVRPAAATAEVLFVAQSLRLAGSGARVGLLVPDGLVSGRRFMPFRAALVRDHHVETVVQLPRGAFLGTDARAYIMIIGKEPADGRRTALRSLERNGKLSPACLVGGAQAEERLDHAFHARAGRGSGPTLKDLGASVARGTLEPCRAVGLRLFHTCDFPLGKGRRALELPEASVAGPRTLVHAEAGDILLARVDRSLERKVCGVAGGAMPISSSVFRIRLAPGLRDRVLDALLTPRGEARIAATARGVGARMLAMDDVLGICPPL